MAWVRRVRTASGATAVQIAEYVHGRRRIVAHIGSAHSEAELALLVERARGLLADAGQAELDLGVEPMSPKVSLARPATDAGLFPEPGRAGTAGERQLVAAPRVIGTSSRLLFEVLA